jgi:hypothetical protein
MRVEPFVKAVPRQQGGLSKTIEKAQPDEVSLLPPHDGRRELPEVGRVPRERVDNDRGSLLPADQLHLDQDAGRARAQGGDERREARDFIHDLISYLETSANVGSSMEGYVKAAKSWLSWNGVDLSERIKIHGTSEAPIVENEVTPIVHELRKKFEVAKVYVPTGIR